MPIDELKMNATWNSNLSLVFNFDFNGDEFGTLASPHPYLASCKEARVKKNMTCSIYLMTDYFGLFYSAIT